MLLGETREELSGSEWAHVVHGHLGGLPPQVDLAAERALAALLADAPVGSAHAARTTCPTAGWPRRWPRRACATAIGATVRLATATRSSACSPSRPRGRSSPCRPTTSASCVALAEAHGVPVTALGVTGGDALEVEG